LSDVSGGVRQVVLATNGFGRGGTQTHVRQVGEGLIRRGFRVAALLPPNPGLDWLRQDLTDAGADVLEAPGEALSRMDRVARVRRMAAQLHGYRDGLFHLHMNNHRAGTAETAAGRLAGFRLTVRTEHTPPEGGLGVRDRLLIAARDRTLDRLILISEGDRTFYARNFGLGERRLAVVPHGVEVGRFVRRPVPALRAELGIGPDELVVGNVANLGLTKGTSQFIEMAATLASELPGLRFLVVGESDLSTGLRPGHFEDEARRRGLGDRIVFAGHVDRDRIPLYLSAMDVFVLASLVESGPYSVLEAMAATLPIVATAVGFVPRVLRDEVSALVVPPADVPALARAVRRLVDDQGLALRLSGAAREAVVAGFTTEIMVDRIAAIYDELAYLQR
jgi:glycosyltransferase involved in cell wall biosynthesis